MPLVRLRTLNFPAGFGVVNGTTDIHLTWAELVWAAISVGKGSLAHLAQHGRYSMFEITYRAAMIYANLLESPGSYFGRSSAYHGLDPSEKGAISYFLGLALTKAFTAKQLGIPWLMHVDVYRQQFDVQLVPIGGRPDLFGLDAVGRWIVAESKGRTNGHDAAALVKAKAQASQVTHISGLVPSLSIGLVASFADGRLTLVVDDPATTTGDEGVRWEVGQEQFREVYYRPFRSLFEKLPSKEEIVADRRIRTVQIDSSDLVVGLDEVRAREPAMERAGAFADVEAEENSFLGMDGIYVRVGESWRDELMRQEPQVRSLA